MQEQDFAHHPSLRASHQAYAYAALQRRMTLNCRAKIVPTDFKCCLTEAVHAHSSMSKANQDDGQLHRQPWGRMTYSLRGSSDISRVHAQGNLVTAEQDHSQLQGRTHRECRHKAELVNTNQNDSQLQRQNIFTVQGQGGVASAEQNNSQLQNQNTYRVQTQSWLA